MKPANRVLAGVAVFLLIVLGAGLLAHNFGFIDLTRLVFGPGKQIWVGFSGMVLLLAGLFTLYLAAASKGPEKYFSTRDSAGEVRVSYSAIEGMLKEPAAGVEGIEDVVPRVFEGKEGLEILNRVAVRDDASIPRVAGQLQEVIKERLREVIGIEDVGAINTHVYRIYAGRRRNESGGKPLSEDG